MELLHLYGSMATVPPFSQTLNTLRSSRATNYGFRFPSPWRRRFAANCGGANGDDGSLSTSSAYDILGVQPSCSDAELKSAFRAKVKQYHPDVSRVGDSETMIRRVIQAYQMLSNYSRSEIIERECLDPFDEPECEALDLFVNELLCVGKVKIPQVVPIHVSKQLHRLSHLLPPQVPREPLPGENLEIGGSLDDMQKLYDCFMAFGPGKCWSGNGTGEDYQVQAAVSQCPRSCIDYVTPSQRVILQELLDSIMDVPYDTSAEADFLYSLIVKARFENDRYRKPKKQPKNSSKHVDWY